ncbi:hypothetical protein SEQ01_03370 [Streptococcus equinus]|nr:hypothetical protein SEQ01_03370 [Streptococcus equinus]
MNAKTGLKIKNPATVVTPPGITGNTTWKICTKIKTKGPQNRCWLTKSLSALLSFKIPKW